MSHCAVCWSQNWTIARSKACCKKSPQLSKGVTSCHLKKSTDGIWLFFPINISNSGQSELTLALSEAVRIIPSLHCRAGVQTEVVASEQKDFFQQRLGIEEAIEVWVDQRREKQREQRRENWIPHSCVASARSAPQTSERFKRVQIDGCGEQLVENRGGQY